VKVDRLYGFDEPVEVTLDIPNGIKGLTANKLTLAKGQAEGKVEVTAAKDAAPGEHSLSVRVKGRFNNIENQSVRGVTLTVVPGT
jgi:hypothetical protein